MLYKRYTLTKVDVNQKYLNPDQSEEESEQESNGENYNGQDEEENGGE